MSDTNNSIVTDPTHIAALVNRLNKNNCTLEIKTTSPTGELYTLGASEILNIDIEENNVLFDAIDKNTLSAGQQIKIFTKHDGIEIYFTTTVTKLTTRNHSNYFNAEIPTSITHKQRRQQYRAVLQNLWKIPVTLIDKSSKNPLSAYVYNISTGGINVRSSTSNFTRIKKDAVIDTVIQLPNDSSIKCKLLIRQANLNATSGIQQLAGQFLNLNAKQEKTIQSFVNTVERNNIKNRAQLQAS